MFENTFTTISNYSLLHLYFVKLSGIVISFHNFECNRRKNAWNGPCITELNKFRPVNFSTFWKYLTVVTSTCDVVGIHGSTFYFYSTSRPNPDYDPFWNACLLWHRSATHGRPTVNTPISSSLKSDPSMIYAVFSVLDFWSWTRKASDFTIYGKGEQAQFNVAPLDPTFQDHKLYSLYTVYGTTWINTAL